MGKYIEPILWFYLKDKTYSVREMVISKLKSLVQCYKLEWVSSSLLPKLTDASAKENSYLIRITALYSLQVKICFKLFIFFIFSFLSGYFTFVDK